MKNANMMKQRNEDAIENGWPLKQRLIKDPFYWSHCLGQDPL